MTRSEAPQQHGIFNYAQTKLRTFVNKKGLDFIGNRITHVTYEGEGNITGVNEALSRGESALLVADHPGTLETIDSTGVITKLTSRQSAGVLVKVEHTSGKIGFSSIVLEALAQHNITPIPIKTPKYHKQDTDATNFNARSTILCRRMLRGQASALLTYASGTRSRKMLEAEPGMGYLSQFADVIVPLTTIHVNGQPKVIIHEPIPGKTGTAWCTAQFQEEGIQAFSDLVMTIIASGQPNKKKRGFYQPYCEAIVNYYWYGITTQDPRVQNMLQAYIALTEGVFSPIVHQ